MPQAHLDRLTSIDAGFLHQEDGGAHMHIGGLGVFAGPPPTGEQCREHIAARLHLVPRYRQKRATGRSWSRCRTAPAGRPVWVEDRDSRVGYHVRHTALPSPGSHEQLLTLTSPLFPPWLDRTKPLWGMWRVEGLADGRFAIVAKTHHAMTDGAGGVDLLTALVDLLAHGAKGAVRNLLALGARGATCLWSTGQPSWSPPPRDAARSSA